ncbi:hypothetical protein BS50DRAFT_634989 [Corynespora cassiicola Philippines]|uniref:Uncharacterized protein n=1 Tax=Corynespora cassiicola Philippines TaxID=1448308 RepID=A0A2T2NK12_CORCC|nr:hypothetical protein BS50DRAFT_634989 [Corynespora cassiicola Philippines]
MESSYDSIVHSADMQLLREDLESQKKRELSLVKECTRLMDANTKLVQSLDKKKNNINCLEQELRGAQQEKLKTQIGLCLEESKVHTAMEDIQKSKRETKNIADAYKKQSKRLQSIQGK